MEIDDNHPRVCSFMGASVMDLISYVDRFPEPGETMVGNNFRKGFGGKAANACIMAARLGLECRMLAKIGNDTFGDEMIENFQQHNISTEFVLKCPDVMTGTAAIIVTRKGENNIVYVPGATNSLTPEEINKLSDSLFKDCRLFVSTFECTPESLHAALLLARKHKVPTLINGAPPFPKPMENSHIYPLCDILCVNESEAKLMTKLRVDTIDDCRIACKMILDKGCGSVILTMGANGALYVNRHQALHIPVPNKIQPLDTTGAGDSFMGSLAFYLVHFPNLTIEETIKRCNIIASTAVTRPGTQDSYPHRNELPEELFL
ncbi:ribokinase [Dermatophagoides farinae]|uniref:ribokinase n=1 Tax=Dermatophagoides farinae TaxID=6954 RepID=UPI003F61B0E4